MRTFPRLHPDWKISAQWHHVRRRSGAHPGRGRSRAARMTAKKTLTLLFVSVAAGLSLRILTSTLPARALAIQSSPARADAILVPGGDPDYERTITAAALWRAGVSPIIIFSGVGHAGDCGETMAAI